MAKALKLMTFNVQQLPWLARTLGNAPIIGSPGGGGPTEPEPETRARAVARAILDMKPREQPDVVVFNEAFGEDGRHWLLSLLKETYPNFIKKLEHPGLDVEEDSGLMLFSKFPFLLLPTGDTFWYKPFPKAAGTDAKAAKGVGIVRVAGPYDPTTIAFTHLQASYDSGNTENMDIRADQFEFLRKALLEVAAGDLRNYANAVITGDLNVKGDPDDTSGEWDLIFANTPNTFGGDFDDAWRAYMHPPRHLTAYDPGYTQRDTQTYIPNRFDYECIKRGANADIGLVAHHIFRPFQLASEITDHWPLMGHLHRISPNCTPSTAVELTGVSPLNKGQPASQVWMLETNFRDEDMYHWVYLDGPGTYSVWTTAPLEVAAFRRTDFSHALDPTDTLSLAQLPPGVQSVLPREQQLVDKGSVFAWREPFFLRFRGKTNSFSGKAGFVIVRHRGESPATAIILLPHLPTDPGLPLGQPLGTTDECFFRADRPERYTAQPYDDHFRLDNLSGVPVKLQLRDAAQTVQPPISTGSGPTLDVVRHGGAETVYLVLRRNSVNDIRFIVTWDSPLTFMALDESLRLHIDDETGPDWPGADELNLNVIVDDDNIYSNTWDDADAGEDWPDLVQSLRSSVLTHQGHAKWVAFCDGVTFDVIKTDGIFAHGSTVAIISPLSPKDRDIETRVGSMKISDPLGDGHLTAYLTISRYPLS